MAVVLACWAAPTTALATSFTVNQTIDDDDINPGTGACDTDLFASGSQCSLRAAIQELNAQGGGPHTINLPADSYTLTRTGDDDTDLNGDLDITANITIIGAGPDRTFVQACDADATPSCTGIDRVFHILPGGSLTMSGVTVRKGEASTDFVFDGAGIKFNGVQLTLTNVVLDRNHADRDGGGLSLIGSGQATLSHVSITNNQAFHGGGISSNVGLLSLDDATISGNTVTATGGGMEITGSSGVTLTNVTIASNTSSQSGGGIKTGSAPVTLRNSIVANNLGGSPSSTSNCSETSIGSIVSGGFNLVFPGSGCNFSTGNSDRVDRDPKLGPLQNNGGPVPTHALLPGSAAVDFGNSATPGSGGAACTATDARGRTRPADGDLNGNARCDIGAFELVPFVVNLESDATDFSDGDGLCDTSRVVLGEQCSLRAAIQEANALGGGVISLPTGSYTLTRSGADDTALSGDLDVTSILVIVGAGPASTFVQACDAGATPNCTGVDRVFDVHSSGSLTMSGVTVRKGNATGPGGGINNRGALILTNVALDGNVSNNSLGGGTNGLGGGLNVIGPGTATLTNVSVTNNRADGGAGIENGGGALTLTNVTVSGNSASGNGGNGGGMHQSLAGASATLTNVTVAGNVSAGDGGGIMVISGTVTLSNSIVAGNTRVSPARPANCLLISPGTFASQGHNLVFPGTGCGLSASSSDLLDQDPKLGPLANNGGPTPTMALLAGSTALDAGSPFAPFTGTSGRCAITDQRGIARPQDGDLDGTARCDIGAFEARLTDLCAQRPPVQLAVAPNGQGGLNATVTRGLGNITQIVFHLSRSSHVAIPNALLQIEGSASNQGDFIFTSASGRTAVQFTVRPLDASKPTTVLMEVTDACGAWSTLVGGGAGAFGGGVGTFTLAGLSPGLAAGQTATLQLAWALPAPRRWRELAGLELRLTDAAGVAWGVRWTESGDTFAVTETRTPALFALAGPHTQGSSPTGQSVTLSLPLQILPAAAGRTFAVEVRATDDAGLVQGFEPAGTLTVQGTSASPAPEPPRADTPSTEGLNPEPQSEERPPKSSERSRWQHTHTNAGSPGDERIEGNVVAIDRATDPPTITIADRDGLVVLRLHGDAAHVDVNVGDYVTAEGEKVTEELYEIDDLTVD